MKILALICLLSCFWFSFAIVDRTYFNYLGLKITANSEEIQNAYQLKKIKIESLENQEEKIKKLKLLKEAYDALSNEQERQKYQRYGKDLFKNIKDITSISKLDPENPKDSRKNDPFKLTIPVFIGDIYNGTTIKAKYPKDVACPVCMGTGAKSPKDLKPCSSCSGKGYSLGDTKNFYGQSMVIENKCAICKGSGKTITKVCDHCHGSKLIKEMQTIQIKIPKGLPDGNKLKLRNVGEQSVYGAPADFEITIVEIPSKQWSRESFNLIYQMEISLEESLFGFERTFLHLDGSEIHVLREEITTKDTKHIVKGQGIVNKQGYPGNLIVKFSIHIPTFTNQQLDMWEDFFNQYPM